MANVAVVTGGAGGMGLAVAHALGREATVLISDVSQERVEGAQNELVNAGIDCAATICDVTDPASVGQLVQRAQELGTVVSVVHTAGVSPSMGSAELILKINAVGTVLINQAFLGSRAGVWLWSTWPPSPGTSFRAFLTPTRRYKKSRTDIERFHSDLLAVCNRLPESRRAQLAYVLSKNFVIWYSKALAAQFGSSGARVLSVSPGSFDTAMGKLEADVGAGALAQIGALKRFGHTAEIAELLAFCASDRAGYLTGTDIICDGGVMAAMTLSNKLEIARQ